MTHPNLSALKTLVISLGLLLAGGFIFVVGVLFAHRHEIAQLLKAGARP